MKSAPVLAMVLLLTACSPNSERPSNNNMGTPTFTVAPADLSSASADKTLVHLDFTSAKAEAFREFTKEHLNEKVQVLVGTNVVAEPVIRSEIPGGKIDVSFPSVEKAQAFVASVNQK